MRSALLIIALTLGCSSGAERRQADEPEAPSETETGFTAEQQQALSELFAADAPAGAAGASPAPPP
jgi:hypothetical protein